MLGVYNPEPPVQSAASITALPSHLAVPFGARGTSICSPRSCSLGIRMRPDACSLPLWQIEQLAVLSPLMGTLSRASSWGRAGHRTLAAQEAHSSGLLDVCWEQVPPGEELSRKVPGR